MSKQLNKENLMYALNEIQTRAMSGVPMNFATICKENHLGESTKRKLRYALLEHKYDTIKSGGPYRKMRVKRDKKTWEFIFLNSDGSKSPAYVMANDLDTIISAMEQCPKEQSNPWYYNKPADAPADAVPEEEPFHVIGEASIKSLAEYSTEELAAELFNRGWIVTYGSII